MKIEVSVIIANKNNGKFLERNIDSVLGKTGYFEIIVVDDGSTDNSLEILRKYEKDERVRVLKLSKNMGAAKARNIGVANARGEFLFFLDADTKIENDFVKIIKIFFEKYKRVGCVQAKLLRMSSMKFDYGGDYISKLGFLIERCRGVKDKGQFDKIEKIFAMKSAAMIIKREVFSKLGGFDEELKIFWEDTDLCWRAWLKGYENYFLPDITVFHAYGTSEKDHNDYIDNKIQFNGCKNMLISQLKNLTIKRVFYILPVSVFAWLLIAFFKLFTFKFSAFFDIINGVLNFIILIPSILLKKNLSFGESIKREDKIFKTVSKDRRIDYYFGKFLAYVTNKEYW